MREIGPDYLSDSTEFFEDSASADEFSTDFSSIRKRR
jgi:hypothetical protein